MTRRRRPTFNDNHRRQLLAEGWDPTGPAWLAFGPDGRGCRHHHPTEASARRCAKAKGWSEDAVKTWTFERVVVPPVEHVTAPEDWLFLVLAAVFVWYLFR